MAQHLKALGAVLAVAASSGGCAAALLGQAGGEPVATASARPASAADQRLAAAVKARLSAQPPLQAVSVESRDAAITLTGMVRAAADRSAAERIARGVKGVKSVRNLLTLE